MKLNKIIAAIGTLSIFATLVSCGGSSEDLTTLRVATVSDSKKEMYNLNFDDATGSKVVESDTYSIYVSSDIKSSLFIYEVDIMSLKDSQGDVIIDDDSDKLRTVISNTLYFSTGDSAIYSTEKAQYISYLYNTTDGIIKLANNDTLGFTPDYSQSLTKTVDLKSAYQFSKDNNLNDVKLNIVYLPTYFVRKNDGNVILSQYVLAPIYMTFVYSNGEKEIIDGKSQTSTIKGIKVATLTFKEGYNDVLEV